MRKIFSAIALCIAGFLSAGTPLIVGPDGDTTTPYTGASGLSNAINKAVQEGAAAGNAYSVFIKPGTYTMSNGFGIPDGVHLVGLTTGNVYQTNGDDPVIINVDYTTLSNATTVVSNISFTPISLSVAAQNIISTTVTFYNCYLGNLNASEGNCVMNCQNSYVAIPASTSGVAQFKFINCYLAEEFLSASVPVKVTLVQSTLASTFNINSGNSLDMSFYDCTCGNIQYYNTTPSSLTLNFTATTISGSITDRGGATATINYY